MVTFTYRDAAPYLLLHDAAVTTMIALLLVCTVGPASDVDAAEPYYGQALELHPDIGYVGTPSTAVLTPPAS